MQCAQEHIGVRRAAAEQIPEHARHSPGAFGLLLFTTCHTQYAATCEACFLHEAGDVEHELADQVVVIDAATKRCIVLFEAVGVDAVEHDRLGRGFRRPVRRADAVLEKPRRSAVADHNQPVSVDRARGLNVDAWIAMADVRRNHVVGKAVPDFRRLEETRHQPFVNIISEQAQRHVLALGYQGRELKPRYVQQEHVHGRPERLVNEFLAEVKFADESLRAIGLPKRRHVALDNIQQATVNAGRHDNKIVVGAGLVRAVHGHFLIASLYAGDEPANEGRAFFLRHFLQIAVETIGSLWRGLPGTVTAVDRGNTLLRQWRGNFDVADIHVQRVRLDAALHDAVRKVDALGREALDKRFRHDAAAVIASGRAAMAELPRLVQVDVGL